MLRTIRRRMLPHWTDYWPNIAAMAEKASVLHLGAGLAPLHGAVSLDIATGTKPDVIWDLNQVPWPFADNMFDGLVAFSVMEHLDDFVCAMGEVHRISKPGAVTSILVPHFSSAAAFVDPTHRQFLSARSCDYFILGTKLESEYPFFAPYRFELVARHIHLQGGLRYVPAAEWFVDRYPAFWEDYLCQILRGGGIFWQLRAIK